MKALLIGSAAVLAFATAGCEVEPEPEVVEVVEPTDPDTQTNGQAETAWDSNSDKVFQEAEYTGWRDRGFSQWDTDADNRLNEREFGTYWTDLGFKEPDPVFSQWDDNGDTFLDDDEFFDDEEWSEWDQDDSGVLETGEFAHY